MKIIIVLFLIFVTASQTFSQSPDSSHLALQLVKTLASSKMEGRESGTKGNTFAREFLIDQLVSLNFEVQTDTFKFKLDKESIEGININAEVKGKKFPEKYLIITAHYDHLGIREGDIYYGADDNASGVAALIVIAKAIKNMSLAHSIRFVFLDAEEKGLKGAFHFVENTSIPLDNILLNINLDMVSQSSAKELFACGTYHNPWIKGIADETADTFTNFTLKFGHDFPGTGSEDWTQQSDHFPFHNKGIPFIYFGVEDHPYYHDPEDTFDKIPRDFFIEVVNFLTAFVIDIDKKIEIN